MSANLLVGRVLAAGAALWLSSHQYRYFDCNHMRGTSLISGMVTVLLAYGTGELLYRSAASAWPLRQVVLSALVGVLLVGAAAFFTMLTHICP